MGNLLCLAWFLLFVLSFKAAFLSHLNEGYCTIFIDLFCKEFVLTVRTHQLPASEGISVFHSPLRAYLFHSLLLHKLIHTSLENIDFQKLAYWSLNFCETSRLSPKSRMTSWWVLGFDGLGLTKIFPGWGSQWINPVTNIC